jgi:hypothetical protein
MTTSAVYLLGTGVVLTFLSQEVAALAGLAEASAGPLLLQLVAALYLWRWRSGALIRFPVLHERVPSGPRDAPPTE